MFNLGAVLITNDSGPAHFAALTPSHIMVSCNPKIHSYTGLWGNTVGMK
jgi:hypothetical protein